MTVKRAIIALLNRVSAAPVFFANKEETEERNTVETPWVANEEYKAEGGWQLLAPYGDFPNPQGLQRFERQDADAIVKDFGAFANIGVKAMGIPFYIGHPDHPAHEARYTDTRAYGRVKKLEARPEGLFGQISWNDHGKQLIANQMFHGHSVNWRMQRVGMVFRPVSLKSVGFTNEPNIQMPPITSANEKQELHMLKEIAKLLGLPETATEADILAKQTLMANELRTAQATLVTLNAKAAEYDGKKTEFANGQTKIATLETEKTTLAGQVTTLTTERDGMKTNFANERAKHSKLVLDVAEKDGKITKAERGTWEVNFANEAAFEATLTNLNKLATKLPTNSIIPLGEKRAVDSQNRIGSVQNMVNEKMRSTPGMTYDAAFAAVQTEKADLFAQMQQPEHAKV
jgi:hypothetical protein